MKVKLHLCAIVLIALSASCKKDKVATPAAPAATGTTTTPPVVATGSALDLIKDSIFLYAKEVYYWNNQLPDYATFNPRKYTGTDELTALQNEVDAYALIAKNPGTNTAYEYYAAAATEAKYSFIDDGALAGRLGAARFAATASTGDYGFAPVYIATNDLRVKFVYPGSPADAAGLKRGYQITSVNGSTNIGYSNVNYVSNAYSANTTITLTLKKPDGTSFNASVTATNYKVNPVLKTSVFDLGNGNKVGYLVFNSYVALANVQSSLDNIFSTFVSNGVNNLIIDLRYNGGGYVETAEYIDNLIAPSSANGSTMYTAYYNSNLTSGNITLLKNQVRRDPANNQLYNYSQIDYSVNGNLVKYTKKGSLTGLTKVVFLVSGSTASASELTINNLRPYMNVQLIGTTTYGKPVGFFDININKYTLYTPEFETKNSNGQGGYYTGMVPGSTDYPGKTTYDDVTKDFGDTSEGMLATALSYLRLGTFSAGALKTESVGTASLLSDELKQANQHMDKANFKGMLYQNPMVHQ